MEKDLFDYTDFVNLLINKESKLVFSNDSNDHAQIITRLFLENAKKIVNIFSGSLTGPWYSDNFKTLIKEALENNTALRVRIIVASEHQTKLDASCIVLKELMDELGSDSNRLAYRVCINKYKYPLKHFITVDDKRYRLEEHHPDHLTLEPKKVHAEVCCNGKDKTARLNEYFNLCWA